MTEGTRRTPHRHTYSNQYEPGDPRREEAVFDVDGFGRVTVSEELLASLLLEWGLMRDDEIECTSAEPTDQDQANGSTT